MSKIKPLLPSLREKKRYLVFKVISEKGIDNINSIKESIFLSYNNLFGEIGMAKAGLLMLNDKYNKELKRGIIKVNNKMLNNLKASICFIKTIEKQNVIVKSIGVSGILKKAESKYIAA